MIPRFPHCARQGPTYFHAVQRPARCEFNSCGLYLQCLSSWRSDPSVLWGRLLLTRHSAGGFPLHVHIDPAQLSGIHSPYNLQLSSPCHSSPAPSRSLSLPPPLKLDCSPRNCQQYFVTKRPADVAPPFIISFNRNTGASLYLPSFLLLPSSFLLPTHHVLHSKLLQSLFNS